MEYGLIGEHLGHSFSKDIHEKLSPFPYELREIAREELPAFLKNPGFKGINVTIPYKEAVIPFLDFIAPEAEKIGAVNTLVRRDGRLCGYNTDYFGFAALADRTGIRFEGRQVLILGAGGAAKTVAAVARDRGAASVTHAVRHPKEPGQRTLGSLGTDEPYEIVVNCTPVGMFPNEEETPVGLSGFPQLAGVLDLIYNPLRTNLILDAEARGIPAACGLYMLVEQAVKARSYFDGEDLPDAVGETIHDALRKAKRNLVFIGMPSCGKSTLGRRLAERCGRPFIDTDERIVARAGKPIPRIFAEDGEDAFRRLEAEVIRDLSARTGLILATGGGAILDPQNVRRLKRNGLLCRIDRSLERLTPTGDRPLSRDLGALKALYEQRKEAYARATEVCIDNNGPLEESLRQAEAQI